MAKRSRGAAVAAVATAVAGALLSAGLLGRAQPAAAATQLVQSAFTSPSNGVTEATSSGWSVSGNSAAVTLSLPSMVDGPDADSDVDRLRLTSTSMNLTGYALYDVAQTTSSGLDVSFNVAMHGYGGNGCPASPSDNYNSTSTGGAVANSGTACQADGFVFFLKNGTNTDTGGTSLGQAGGSLGYAPQNSSSGLSGALLGIGLDAYGNFYQRPFSGTDCTSDPSNSTSQYARRSLIVRGPMGGTRSTGYCRIATDADRTASSRNIGVDLSGFSNLFTSTGQAVRITIDTTDTSGSRTHGTGKVYIAAAGTSDWSSVSATATFALPQALHDASTFKFGFVAGTGGGAMNTDLWGAQVSSISDVADPSITTAGPFCASTLSAFSQQLSASEGVAPYSFSVSSGSSMPAGLTVTSGGLIQGTPTAAGTFSTSITVADSSSSTGSGSRSYTFTVLQTGCDSRIAWSIAGEPPTPPSGGDNDGSCSAGNYSQVSDGTYRIAIFSAPAAGSGSCTWTAPSGVVYVEALVVGGGGGGGYDAGAGGGGGGVVYHSAITASSSATITVGGGGAGSTTSSPWSSKTGAAGSASSLALGSVTLTGAGGGGGRGCNWNGSICTTSGNGNTGGAGGTATGGTINVTGGSGGNGVWTSVHDSQAANIAQSGGSGSPGQTGLSRETYGCGGGGSGAGLTAGSGGCVRAASGITGAGTPANATAGFGGGGAGGNQASGSNGGSGTVILRYALLAGTNDPAVAMERSMTGLLTLSTQGTMKRQYATWSAGSGCGSTWTTDADSITSATDSTSLVRGRCYRWTHDSGVASGAARPTDTDSYAPKVNLTSPPVALVPAVALTVPATVPVDPRATTVDGLPLQTSGADSVLVCLFQGSQETPSGIGTPAGTPSLTFDVSTLGSAQTSVDETTVTGDTTSELSVSGTVSSAQTLMVGLRITRSAGFAARIPVLIRLVPVYSGFTSSCSSGAGGLRPFSSGTAASVVVPLELATGYRTPVPIGRQ